jgi:hypothetical protein
MFKVAFGWVLQRNKAFLGAAAAGVILALIKAFETSYGIDVSATWEASILATVTGLFIERVPNKA